MTTKASRPSSPSISAVASEAISPSLARRLAIPSAIGYRSVHALRSPAPLVSPWPVGPVASPSLGGIGKAHAPTMRCSRRRGTPSLFQALLSGAADLVSWGAGKASQPFPIEAMTTKASRPSSPSISAVASEAPSPSLSRRVAIPSAIDYRLNMGFGLVRRWFLFDRSGLWLRQASVASDRPTPQPCAAADAVDRPRLSKPSCPARLILFR